jgi:hypothetical protein
LLAPTTNVVRSSSASMDVVAPPLPPSFLGTNAVPSNGKIRRVGSFQDDESVQLSGELFEISDAKAAASVASLQTSAQAVTQNKPVLGMWTQLSTTVGPKISAVRNQWSSFFNRTRK